MLSSFSEHPAVDASIDRASAALNQDMRSLIEKGPVDDLNLTVNTQPAMLTAGFSMYEAWRAAGGVEPALMAGHSLGEYTALTAARALTLEDAVRLVRFRATAMQEAVPVGVGAMAAILGLSDDDVRRACAESAAGEVVEAVNFNAPAQVVIAGHKSAVERACEAAKQLGAKRALILPVSAPFHSSLMQPAATRLREYLVVGTLGLAGSTGLEQCRRRARVRARAYRRCIGTAGRKPGALGRDDPVTGRAGGHSCHRVWTWKSARRADAAHCTHAGESCHLRR